MLNAFGVPDSVLLVGGTSGIGLAIVSELVKKGARRVGLAGRTQSDGFAGAVTRITALGAEVTPIDYDAAVSPADWAGRQVLENSWDCAVFAVGLLGEQDELLGDPSGLADLLEINFTATATATVLAGEAMATRGQGQIVVLSSVAAVRGRPANFVYAASKAGLDAVGVGLMDHLHGTGVQVVVVRPGFVRTKMTQHLADQPFATDPEEVASDVVEALGTRRSQVVWSPKVLQGVYMVLRLLPRAVWRRLP